MKKTTHKVTTKSKSGKVKPHTIHISRNAAKVTDADTDDQTANVPPGMDLEALLEALKQRMGDQIPGDDSDDAGEAMADATAGGDNGEDSLSDEQAS